MSHTNLDHSNNNYGDHLVIETKFGHLHYIIYNAIGNKLYFFVKCFEIELIFSYAIF